MIYDSGQRSSPPPALQLQLVESTRATVLVSATYVGESVKGRAVEQPARERGRIASAWSDGDGVGSAKTFTSGAGRRGATERVVAWNGQRQSRSRALVGRLLEATENMFNLKRMRRAESGCRARTDTRIQYTDGHRDARAQRRVASPAHRPTRHARHTRRHRNAGTPRVSVQCT